MSNSIHISNEADRRAHEALNNIRNLNRYRSQRALLDQKKSELAREVGRRFPSMNIIRVSNAIQSAQQLLEQGNSFQEAFGYACNLLTDVKA